MQTLSSNAQILRTVLSSCSLATDFFSTPRTTMSFPRTPTFNKNQHGTFESDQRFSLQAQGGKQVLMGLDTTPCRSRMLTRFWQSGPRCMTEEPSFHYDMITNYLLYQRVT